MKKMIFLLLICSFLIIGCSSNSSTTNDYLSGQRCVECGLSASRLAGTGWIESQNNYGKLYLCENCYNKMYDNYEENDRIPDEKFWEVIEEAENSK